MEQHIGILSFSTSSLPDDMRKTHHAGLAEVPFHITYEQKNKKPIDAFLDTPEISIETEKEFLANLNTKYIKVNSAQPNESEILNKLDQIRTDIKNLDGIVEICPSKLSGVLNPASSAAEMYTKETGIETLAIDSNAISMAEGFAVIKAFDLAQKGADKQAVLDSIPESVSRTNVAQVFSSLDQLRKNGRIGNAKHLAAGVLGLNALITLKDGDLEPIESSKRGVKGWERANKKAIEFVANRVGKRAVELAIVHFGIDEAQLARSEYLARNIIGNVEGNTLFSKQSRVLVAHTDVGTTAYCAFEK